MDALTFGSTMVCRFLRFYLIGDELLRRCRSGIDDCCSVCIVCKMTVTSQSRALDRIESGDTVDY